MRRRALLSVLVAGIAVAGPSHAWGAAPAKPKAPIERLSDRAATTKAIRHTETLLEATKVTSVPRNVLNERAALKSGKAGQVLVDSMSPRYVKRDGEWVGIDNTLRRRAAGGWEPEAGTTNLRLPATAGGEAALERLGVTVSLGAVRDVAGRADEAGVVYPNVLPDTDALYVSRAGGLQVAWVLRSAASPLHLPLDLTLAQGQFLVRDGNGFAVRTGGKDLARVEPPVAWDAAKQPVDVRLERTAAGLQVIVAPAADARYPIVVDPVIDAPTSDSYPWTRWRTGWVTGYDYWDTPQIYENSQCSGTFDWDVVGYTTVEIMRTCGQNDPEYGEVLFDSPGQSFISRIDTSGFYFAYGGGCGHLGLRSPSGTEEGFFSFQSGNRSTTAINAPCNTGTPVQTVCAAYSCSVAGSPGNSAYFGIDWTAGGAYSAGTGIGVLSDVTLYREDNDSPTVSVTPSSGALPWTRTGNGGSIHVAATDDSLGAKILRLRTAGGTVVGSFEHGCTGTVTDPCAATWSWYMLERDLSADSSLLPEGIVTLHAEAEDAVGNRSAGPGPTGKVAVDRSGPAITFPNGGVITGTPLNGTAQKTVQINAADGVSGGTDAQRRSGVVGMTVSVSKPDNSGFQQEASYTQSCATDSCSMSRQFVIDATKYGPGQHTVRVTATDKAGNTSTNDLQFVIDTVGPAISLSGSLWDNGSPSSVPSSTLTDDEYRLQADVIDGVFPLRGAGVKDIELYVTEQIGGVPIERQLDATTRTCKDISCDRTLVATVDTTKLAPGPLTFRVRATDSLGNVSNRTFYAAVGTITFDQTRWSGLEDFLQYDELDTGAGSSAYVNLVSGNLVWQHTPLVNPGRGLSTFAQVTYNAQSASTYNELSSGWSLSISGLTRVNEPLDLSTEPYGSIRLIDGDGTQHPFKLSADGTHYIAPPGVQLHLRRFDTNLKSWAVTRPDGVTFYYDSRGFQSFVEDRNGNTLRFAYDIVPRTTGVTCPTWPVPASGTLNLAQCRQRLVSVTDAEGLAPTNVPNRSVTLAYASATGPITSITDHAARVTQFVYDVTTQRLTALREAVGTTAQRSFGFGYEPTGTDRDLGSVTDPRGYQTQFTYTGGFGTLTQPGLTQDPLADKRVTTLRDRRTNTHTFAYSTATAGSDSWWTATMTDARSKSYSYRMDRRGRPVKRVDPLSTTTLMGYDADNNLVKLTEASGTADEAVTRTTYNRNGRLLEEIDPLGRRTVLRYQNGTGYSPGATFTDARTDYVSDLIRIEKPKGADTGDPNDYATRLELDARGNVTAMIDATGGRSETYYLDWGLVDYEKDPVGNITSYHQYDASGFPREVRDPKNGRWFYAYDAVGNVTAVADPRSEPFGGLTDPQKRFRTTLVYDALDRLKTEQVPKRSALGQFITRTYWYDENGNIERRLDGNGGDASARFDAMDNVLENETPPMAHVGEFSPAAEITKYTYDAEQNVATQTQPKGVATAQADDYSTAYVYDAINRPVIARARSRAGSSSVDLITSFAYDRRNNVVGQSDPRANAEWPADPETNARTTARQRWAFTYDKADQQTAKVQDPGGLQLTTRTDYDEHGNVTRVRDPRNKTVEFGPADPLTPNATYETLTSYDAADRTVTQTRDGSTTEVVRRADGKIVEVRHPRYFTAERQSADDFVTKYAYDAAGDILTVTQPRIASSSSSYANKVRTLQFTRDAVGNAATITDPRGRTISNTYLDTGDLLTTTRPSLWRFSAGAGGEEVSLKDLAELGNAAEQPDTGEQDQGEGDGQSDFGTPGAQRQSSILPDAGDVEFSYDNELRLTTVTELESSVIATYKARRLLARDHLGRVTDVSMPYQRAQGGAKAWAHENLQYDRNGNVVRHTDPEGNVTTTLYDQFDRKVSTTTPPSSDVPNAPGNTTQFFYDENSNVTSVREPKGADWTTYACYDKADRLVAQIDQQLAVTRVRLDNIGQVVRQRSPRGTAQASSNPTCSTYPMLDGGPRGSWDTDAVFDPNGWLTQLAAPLGNASTYTYDRAGNLTQALEPGAKPAADQSATPRVTTRTYDARDLPWATSTGTDATPNVKTTTVTEFDGNQNLRRKVNMSGLANGLPRYPDAAPEVSSYASASDRANTAIRDATWRAELHEYSEDNQLVTTHRPWGEVNPNPADPDPEALKRYRQDFERDVRGYVASVRRMNEWTTNPALCASAAGAGCVKVSSYTHYDNGWIHTATAPDAQDGTTAVFGERQIYDYDRRGLQTKWETVTNRSANNPDGVGAPARTTTRAYFPSGKLSARTAFPAGPNNITRQWTYAYDVNGNRTSLQDSGDLAGAGDDKAYALGYDRVGRPTVHDDLTAGQDTLTTYDLAGNRVSQKTDGDYNVNTGSFTGGKTTGSEWDELDREWRTTVSIDGSSTIERWEHTFHPSGEPELTKEEEKEGLQDWATRLKESRYFRNDGLIIRNDRVDAANESVMEDGPQVYTYDLDGNLIKDESGDYEYNAQSQLTKWTRRQLDENGELSSAIDITEYKLDGDGELRQEIERTGGEDVTGTVDYNYLGDRLMSTVVGGTDPTERSTTYSYDTTSGANPASITEGSGDGAKRTTYTYDAYNRVKSSTPATQANGSWSSDTQTDYGYDSFDRQASRTTGPNQTVNRYVGGTEQLSKQTRSGDTRGFDYSASGEALGMSGGEGYRSFGLTANGSVSTLEDSNGASTPVDGKYNRYRYDPYGAARSALAATPEPWGTDIEGQLSEDAQANPLRFQGFMYDSALKTYDMHARMYRPEAGRFQTADRLEDSAKDLALETDPLTQNRYAWAGGNPITNVEYDGHRPVASGRASYGAAGSPKIGDVLESEGPVANVAGIPCDGMTSQQCAALRAVMARAQAERRKAEDAYFQYAAEFSVWVATVEKIKDIASVVNRPGLFNAVNMLRTKKTNIEGARLLTAVRNVPLQNVIKSNYRYGAKIGKGSSAEALKDEVKKGVPWGTPGSHYIKAVETITNLNKIIKRQPLSRREKQIATNIRQELWEALPPHRRPKLW